MIHDTNYELFMAMTKPRVTWKAKSVCGRAIWYAHQGPMRVRTGPKLTKETAGEVDYLMARLERREALLAA